MKSTQYTRNYNFKVITEVPFMFSVVDAYKKVPWILCNILPFGLIVSQEQDEHIIAMPQNNFN